MSKRDFHRYSALGNDYLVIDPAETAAAIDSETKLTPEKIRLICDRHWGVGSDGILYGPLGNPEESQGKKTFRLRIFNPDGSEAEKSGNGLRIFSRFIRDRGLIPPEQNKFDLITTLGGRVEVELLDRKGDLIKIQMGKRSFKCQDLPMKTEREEMVNAAQEFGGRVYHITCVSMGNPHCVVLCGPEIPLSQDLARELGPTVENHPLFPNRTNMQLLKVLDRKTIQIEIWERGAGYTLASGSSSCAAASAAHRLGLVDDKIKVVMPGGSIAIELEGNGQTWMTGPVKKVCSGFFAEDFFL